MAAQSQPAPSQTARELFRSLRPWNAQNRRTIALAYLAEGDLPAGVVYSFCRAVSGDEGKTLLREMNELRAQHFAKLGKPVPADDGPAIR